MADNELSYASRNISMQNGSNFNRILRNKLREHFSTAILSNFVNNDNEVAYNDESSSVVVGNPVIQFAFGGSRNWIHHNTLDCPANDNGAASHMIYVGMAAHENVVEFNECRGAVVKVFLGLESATTTTGSTLNFGYNQDASAMNNKVMGPSTGNRLVGNKVFSTMGARTRPLMFVDQVTDTRGEWALTGTVISGNEALNADFSLFLQTHTHTATKNVIESYSGNTWFPGADASRIGIDALCEIEERHGNAGDPGSLKLEDQTFGSIEATFPGGPSGGLIDNPGEALVTIWDLATGPGPARVGNGVVRYLDGSIATQRISFTATSQTNTTRDGNRISRSGGTAGTWDAAQRTTAGMARADGPTLQARHVAGSVYALGLDNSSGGAASPTASKISVAVDTPGELLVFVSGFTATYASMGISVGDGEVWTPTFSSTNGTNVDTIDVTTSRGQTAHYELGNPADGPTGATLYPIVSLRDGIADVTWLGAEGTQYPAAGSSFTITSGGYYYNGSGSLRTYSILTRAESGTVTVAKSTTAAPVTFSTVSGLSAVASGTTVTGVTLEPDAGLKVTASTAGAAVVTQTA